MGALMDDINTKAYAKSMKSDSHLADILSVQLEAKRLVTVCP